MAKRWSPADRIAVRAGDLAIVYIVDGNIDCASDRAADLAAYRAAHRIVDGSVYRSADLAADRIADRAAGHGTRYIQGTSGVSVKKYHTFWWLKFVDTRCIRSKRVDSVTKGQALDQCQPISVNLDKSIELSVKLRWFTSICISLCRNI